MTDDSPYVAEPEASPQGRHQLLVLTVPFTWSSGKGSAGVIAAVPVWSLSASDCQGNASIIASIPVWTGNLLRDLLKGKKRVPRLNP